MTSLYRSVRQIKTGLLTVLCAGSISFNVAAPDRRNLPAPCSIGVADQALAPAYLSGTRGLLVARSGTLLSFAGLYSLFVLTESDKTVLFGTVTPLTLRVLGRLSRRWIPPANWAYRFTNSQHYFAWLIERLSHPDQAPAWLRQPDAATRQNLPRLEGAFTTRTGLGWLHELPLDLQQAVIQTARATYARVPKLESYDWPAKILSRRILDALNIFESRQADFRHMERNIERHPQELIWPIRRASLLADLGLFNWAIQALDALGPGAAAHSETLRTRVRATYGRQPSELTLELLDAARQANPGDFELIWIGLDYLIRSNQFKKSREWALPATNWNYLNLNEALWKAKIHLGLKHYQRAQKILFLILSADPLHPEVYDLLSSIPDNKKYAQALELKKPPLSLLQKFQDPVFRSRWLNVSA